MGAIRTEETVDNSLINGVAYSVIHSLNTGTHRK